MDLSEILKPAIDLCIDGHSNFSKKEKGKTRAWDRITPYAIHPIWCAMTFLQETESSIASNEKRTECALALIFHDFLEDTTLALPNWLPVESAEMIHMMTFTGEAGSTEIEIREIWHCHPIIRLLKLYDKVSNLLDGSWMPNQKWNGQYVPYVSRLASDVDANYGDLNIVRMARAVAIPRSIHRA